MLSTLCPFSRLVTETILGLRRFCIATVYSEIGSLVAAQLCHQSHCNGAGALAATTSSTVVLATAAFTAGRLWQPLWPRQPLWPPRQPLWPRATVAMVATAMCVRASCMLQALQAIRAQSPSHATPGRSPRLYGKSRSGGHSRGGPAARCRWCRPLGIPSTTNFSRNEYKHRHPFRCKQPAFCNKSCRQRYDGGHNEPPNQFASRPEEPWIL